MPLTKTLLFAPCLALLIASHGLAAAEMNAEEAWKAMPLYEFGRDMAPLLAMDREVIQSMSSRESRAACAARLAALLDSAQTTAAAKLYICSQLRQVGTAAEVPRVAKMLANEATSDMARRVLEAIPGDESLEALRGALGTFKGLSLVGVMNSLAARKDAASAPRIQALAGSEDPQVAAAAIWALGQMGTVDATWLDTLVKKPETPLPQAIAVPLLRLAESQSLRGNAQIAATIYAKLSEKDQATGIRRAALIAQMPHDGEPLFAAIMDWLGSEDPDRRAVAAGRLTQLTDAQLGQAETRLAALPASSQRALVEVLASRRGDQVLPLVISMAKSDQPALKLAGVRCLGEIGDASVIPLLVDTLADQGDLGRAAQQSLASLPRKEVIDALLVCLSARPDVRVPAIEVLRTMRCYEAIDPLLIIAADANPDVYGPALDGLRGIADPDDHDVPRLVKLLLSVDAGRHRDEVEKTILIVCEKSPANADQAATVLKALAKASAGDLPKYLPLLGRLGGPKSLELIETSLKSADPQAQDSAVRALCNWPDAGVADRLLAIASGDDKNHRRSALRAYIRVITLKSDRPESQTLAMLRSAMKLAATAEDRQLVLERASTVRTLESVDWIASHLNDQDVCQAACLSIVELAHHRFLRHPNMDRFGPLLDQVIKTSKDPQVVERAKRYKLGL